MNQQDVVKSLQENPQQAKQFNEVALMINDAYKKEMPTFLKLIQFDVLAEIQKKAVADGVKNANAAEKQLTEALDQIFNQIGKDLDAQISRACNTLKAQS